MQLADERLHVLPMLIAALLQQLPYLRILHFLRVMLAFAPRDFFGAQQLVHLQKFHLGQLRQPTHLPRLCFRRLLFPAKAEQYGRRLARPAKGGHNGGMNRFGLQRDTIIFILLVLPLPFIGMLNVSTRVRFLLLLPIVVLQALFVWNGLRRGGRPRR